MGIFSSRTPRLSRIVLGLAALGLGAAAQHALPISSRSLAQIKPPAPGELARKANSNQSDTQIYEIPVDRPDQRALTFQVKLPSPQAPVVTLVVPESLTLDGLLKPNRTSEDSEEPEVATFEQGSLKGRAIVRPSFHQVTYQIIDLGYRNINQTEAKPYLLFEVMYPEDRPGLVGPCRSLTVTFMDNLILRVDPLRIFNFLPRPRVFLNGPAQCNLYYSDTTNGKSDADLYSSSI
jgi:hypothetical protein